MPYSQNRTQSNSLTTPENILINYLHQLDANFEFLFNVYKFSMGGMSIPIIVCLNVLGKDKAQSPQCFNLVELHFASVILYSEFDLTSSNIYVTYGLVLNSSVEMNGFQSQWSFYLILYACTNIFQLDQINVLSVSLGSHFSNDNQALHPTKTRNHIIQDTD
jgi:hypothetical protein